MGGSLNNMMMVFVAALIILCQICFSGAIISFTLFIVSAVDISFTIVPETQYVYVNGNVTFECAINVTQFNPSFVTNPSVDGSELSSGSMASLSLIATSEVNGTEVTCEGPNGAITEPVYLYVQGQYNVD
ncbi:PREDICTED: uncharacterized protein LOC109591338 [Amphimedon queenslandica]|uniref:Uncharacterized protein n=1 Tax=Amphimedon queenslandica TaxID=400682 RepID=A0AAN0K062_AMPQE|nr:PREDICTED: uncharacterized protein LOC109591338 [Amphimedon queenslandica]|eukprot:XP_019862649.1 PREDICTED: uncharacterized protein LOC109591338 [Amphimedon queenslandica]